MKNLALILAISALVPLAYAAEIHVPVDYPTIQPAIDSAHDGDLIIVAPGTYAGRLNFNGKAITLRSSDPADWETIKSTVIDGKQRNHCLLFNSYETRGSIVKGFTIANGAPLIGDQDLNVYESPYSSYVGGGVICVNASPTISNCIIVRNGKHAYGYEARAGGGIMLLYGSGALIENCIIAENASRGTVGCAVSIFGYDHQDGLSEIVNCTIINNFASYSGANVYQVHSNRKPFKLLNSVVYSKSNSLDSVFTRTPDLITYCCLNSLYQGENYYGTQIDLSTTIGNVSADPEVLRYQLDEFNGPVGDYRLKYTSPCVNAGDPAYAGEGEFDIEGQPRVMAGRVDMGADEVAPTIEVTAPAAGEILAAASARKIRWNSYLYSGPVDIKYTIDGGLNWVTIAENQVNTGIYDWTLPDVILSDQCVVGVFATEEPVGIDYKPSGIFTARPYNPDPPIDSPWPAQAGSSTRSGSTDATGPELGCLKWKLETDGTVLSGVSVGADGNVHAVSQYDGDYTYNPATDSHIAPANAKLYTVAPGGGILWTIETDAKTITSPSVGPDGTIYFGTDTGKLYAVDKDGMTRWTYTAGKPIIASPAVDDSGRIFAACGDSLIAFAPNGTQLWLYDLPMLGRISDEIIAAPASDGNCVYFASAFSPTVYALDAATGDLAWTCEIPEADGFVVSPVVTPDGNVLVNAIGDDMFYALACETGEIVWSIDLDDSVEVPGLVPPVVHLPFEENFNDTVSGYTSYCDGVELKSVSPAVGEGYVSLNSSNFIIRNYSGITGTNARTVSVWVNQRMGGDIFDYGRVEPGKRWRLFFDSNGGVTLGLGSSGIYTDRQIGTGWHRITVVLDDVANPTTRDAHVYIDGARCSPRYVNPDMQIDTAIVASVRIGETFVGEMDDIRFYNYAMTEDMIRRTYLAQKSSGRMFCEPAVAKDGTIYVSMDSPTLIALNPDGTVKWNAHLGQVGGYMLALGGDGLIYAAGDDGTMYVVSPDGDELARFDGEDRLSYPAIGEGMLYVGDSAGAVYALGSECADLMELHRPANVAADGRVNLADLAMVASSWLDTFCLDAWFEGTCGGLEVQYFKGDINRDLTVDRSDLMLMIENWLSAE